MVIKQFLLLDLAAEYRSLWESLAN